MASTPENGFGKHKSVIDKENVDPASTSDGKCTRYAGQAHFPAGIGLYSGWTNLSLQLILPFVRLFFKVFFELLFITKQC